MAFRVATHIVGGFGGSRVRNSWCRRLPNKRARSPLSVSISPSYRAHPVEIVVHPVERVRILNTQSPHEPIETQCSTGCQLDCAFLLPFRSTGSSGYLTGFEPFAHECLFYQSKSRISKFSNAIFIFSICFRLSNFALCRNILAFCKNIRAWRNKFCAPCKNISACSYLELRLRLVHAKT